MTLLSRYYYYYYLCLYSYLLHIGGETLFEGDIKGIDPISFVASLQGGIVNSAVRDEQLRWENGIVPYQISTTFTHNEKTQILKAFKQFHNATCIKFFERVDEDDFIYLFPGDGCWSSIGRKRNNNSLISLQKSECLTIGIIQHEIIHALGFYHEQSRTDRDEYVDIFWQNIKKGSKNDNFLKYTDSEIYPFGQPYDFDSIMHYGKHDFAKEETLISIAPKDKYRDKQIGQRERLSPIDLKKINLMYNCNSGMQQVPLALSERTLAGIDPKTIIEAKDWNISFPANFVSTAIITLPDAKNSRDCLENCYMRNETGCHLVQFNLETRKCTGFTANVEGTFRPNANMSLLAVSRKNLTGIPSYTFGDQNPFIYGADGNYVANNGVIDSEAQCSLLYHLHPKCNDYSYSFNGDGSSFSWLPKYCFLKMIRRIFFWRPGEKSFTKDLPRVALNYIA